MTAPQPRSSWWLNPIPNPDLVWRRRDAARGLFGGWRPATDREREAHRRSHCPHTVARALIDTVVMPQALPRAVRYHHHAMITVLSRLDHWITWRECSVVASDATRVRIHYYGYSSTHDEWIARDSDRLRLPVGTFSVLFTTAGGAVHHREVFVLESEATRMRVHYIGSPPTHDEWVARDRFSLHLPSAVSHRRRQRRPEPRSNIVAGMRGRESL